MENKKKKIDIKEILKDKQKRAIIILGIYFIFFIFLAASIRNNYNPDGGSRTAHIINGGYAPEKVELDSYDFEYKIMSDGKLNTYLGKKYKNKQQFTYNNNEYFKEDNKYYKKIDTEWTEVENPFIYSEYLDFNILNAILAKSEYDSTTNFKDGKTAISYKMYLNDTITDNIMTLTAKDNILEKIEINLDKDSIILEFSNQNKVKDFNK